MSAKKSASSPGSLQKPEPGAAYRRKTVPWDDPEFETNYPTLSMYLMLPSYEDGKPRLLSTLTMFFDNNGLTVVLNDRDNARSSFFNCASLFSTLLAIEEALSTGEVEWKGKASSDRHNGEKIPF